MLDFYQKSMMMVFERSMVHALVLLLLLVSLCPVLTYADSTAGDYQAPDFDAELFDRDAVSLAGGDLADVIEALTAVVRNFDSVAHIDTDVKEKALALALRLQPLNPAARAAHQLMSDGQGPSVGLESILSYSDTMKIFEVLAGQGERLLRERSQPDDEILGPLLMEIGLTILSPREWESQEVQKLAHIFHEVGGKGELEGFWKLTVRQQSVPGDGASLLASRLAALQPLEELKTANVPTRDHSTAPTRNLPTQAPSTGDFPETSIMFIADVLGVGGASLADASAKIIDVDAGESGSASKVRMRLAKTGPENSALRGVATGQTWITRTLSSWPEGRQASVRLSLGNEDKVCVTSAPGERWPVEVSLPVALAVYSAFSKTEIAADVAVSGRIDNSGTIRSLLPRSEVLREVGENIERIAILALARDELAESNGRSSPAEIEVLGRVQVIEIGSIDELHQVAVADLRPPELTAALAGFAEVQRVGIRADNLSSPELREKLAAVAALWPGHYSAQRLLQASAAVGAMSTTTSVPVQTPAAPNKQDEIDQLLEPLLARYAADRDPRAATEIGGLDDLVSEAELRLRGLSTAGGDPDDRYRSLASALVDSLADYLTLNNRGNDNANANKHRQVIEQQLAEMDELRKSAARGQ